ncbi:hypothetical protein GBAR_LOCUS1676, partial [Geodia barretti]
PPLPPSELLALFLEEGTTGFGPDETLLLLELPGRSSPGKNLQSGLQLTNSLLSLSRSCMYLSEYRRIPCFSGPAFRANGLCCMYSRRFSFRASSSVSVGNLRSSRGRFSIGGNSGGGVKIGGGGGSPGRRDSSPANGLPRPLPLPLPRLISHTDTLSTAGSRTRDPSCGGEESA